MISVNCTTYIYIYLLVIQLLMSTEASFLVFFAGFKIFLYNVCLNLCPLEQRCLEIILFLNVFITDCKNSVWHVIWLIALLFFKRVSFYLLEIVTLNFSLYIRNIFAKVKVNFSQSQLFIKKYVFTKICTYLVPLLH